MIRAADIRQAWRVDLFDACYGLSSEALTVFNDLPAELLPKRTTPFSVLCDLWRNLYRITSNRSGRKTTELGQILFFTHTQNNTKAMKFLQSHYQGRFINSSDICSLIAVCMAPLFSLRLLSFYRSSSAVRRKSMWLYFHEYLGFYPLFLGALSFLRDCRPKAVFFANDHSVSPRATFFAAKSLKIPTVYIQHASTTAKMPPLSFDLALLDGQATLERYRKVGPVQSKVALIGMPRMPAVAEKRKEGTGIGLCTSLLDRLDLVEETVIELQKTLPDRTLVLRYHPGEHGPRKESWEHLANNYGLHLSRYSEESIGEFLGSVSMLIAGDCAVHLESSLLGVPSVMTPWSGKPSDRYGYVENGLIPLCPSISHLTESVNSARVSAKALAYFVAVRDPMEARGASVSAIDQFLELRSGEDQ